MNYRAMIMAVSLSALVACGGGSGGSRAVIVPLTPLTPVDSGPVVEVPPPPVVDETPPLVEDVTPPPPPPPVADPNAVILGELLAYGTQKYDGYQPLEFYTFSGNAVRYDHPSDPYPVVRDTTASIINVPGWSGSKWVRKDAQGLPGGLRDEFVILTDKDGASDMNYMNLAYWIRYTPDDSVPYEDIHLITTISVGSTLLLPGVGDNANGSATYSGPAMGLYAKKERGVYQESGEFRAQAALSVDFDATPPPGVTHWKPPIAVNGTITDFRDAQGNVIDNSWNVTLQEHLYDGSKLETYQYQTGTTAGGNNYTLNFFGPATADGNNDINPEYIGGSFRESFPNGAVSGAFAAKRD